MGKENEKELKRRAVNPITGEKEIINNMSYKQWLKQNNIIGTKNNMFKTNQNVVYNTKSLSLLNKDLVKNNAIQLRDLINKYPKVKDFIEKNGLYFGGEKTNAIAVTSHSYDMKRLSIHLSNDYYKNENIYNKTLVNNIEKGNFMPCADKDIDKYALTHEFGHLLENCLINEYNINNPLEFNDFKNELLKATNNYQAKKIFNEYENKITNNIAKKIYNIALKNNSNFDLSDNLSKYGASNSKEFFAECFANMESNKPNELGKAIKEYLKGVM